ncbi:hypothetical protein JCGZ_07241 [Jatropha curcas]|uniref:OVATE domain-containing protein n=1 Tax=Jatropha curcas TaxID=180498 RepID=A0A067KN20_JATCU|nr:uncharacterized protein LOC105637714 [Jatropha curcas]KDP33670.1 hypothetical protein JCGZ_07241 [Jatropha curcas]
MLLKSSFSNTKKFFQKTLQSFKSFFSGSSYEKMPKTLSPYNPYSNVQTRFNKNDLDNFYTDFSDRWDTDKGKEMNKGNKKKIEQPRPSSPAKQEKSDGLNGSFMKFSKKSPVKTYISNNKGKGFQRGKRLVENSSNYSVKDDGRSFLVAQKLRELEMMDVSNVDHVLDIEEILHYYSRLTCPAYLDIVDNFFMEMYAEIFVQPAGTPRSVNSKPNSLSSIRL